MSAPHCPRCHAEVGSTWRWCLVCGYDPDGASTQVRSAALKARERQSWVPVIVVVLGLIVGGMVLWKLTPDDANPTPSAPMAIEADWRTFTPPGGGFSVEVPGDPTETSQPADALGRRRTAYNVFAESQLFTVMRTSPGGQGLRPGAGAEAVDAALRSNVAELAAQINGTVESLDPVFVNGVRAVRFRVTGSSEARGIMMVVGSDVLGAWTFGTEVDADDAERMIGSFRAE